VAKNIPSPPKNIDFKLPTRPKLDSLFLLTVHFFF
jgi:hypothetical protein